MSINFKLVFYSFLLLSCPGKEEDKTVNLIPVDKTNQQVDGKMEKLNINGYELRITRKESVETKDGYCEVQNSIFLTRGSEELHSFSVCTADLKDVQFVKKGYLTVVEHYSSPVGWSKYYVFDFCKKRIIETKRLDEGTEIEWASFIDFDSGFEESTIEKIVHF